jgi:Right handed beta helix region
MRHQSLIGRAVALVFFGIATASLGMLTAQEAGAAPQSSDGPATLPEIYIQTALSDTPAPGKTWEANTSADFQDRLNRAQCGDVIKLQAGATFAGQFYLPAKSCDDQHWIIVRTAASDSALPPEGTRLTPCYAGVSSLPARPALHCLPGNSAGTSVLAKIDGLPPLDSHGKAVDHYRFVGLEITHPVAAQAPMLLGLGVGSNHIVVDRCWIHGNPTDGTQRGMALNGSYLAVVDSTITDIHMVATDTQGIAAWTGTGPLKIVNNFIEGGSSSIGFGGAGSEVTPRDIEIRGNHLFKPLSWKLGDPNFIGVTFNCKVSLESKNSSRVLIEGNILENTWGGPQGGDGDAIWFGPKNQNNVCPRCEVNDVTFRYNIIRHAGAGIYMFDAPSDAGGIAQPASRYSIHDNLLQDIRMQYAGPGTGKGLLFRFLGIPRFLPPRDVSIQHNTGVTDGGILQLLSTPEAPLINFVFQDNLISNGDTAISGCRHSFGTDVLESCAHGYVFVNNVIVDSAGDFPKSNGSFKKDKDMKFNLYPKKWRDVGLASTGENSAANFRLCSAPNQPAATCSSASPYAGAGTDSRDVGADVSKIYQLTAKAE